MTLPPTLNPRLLSWRAWISPVRVGVLSNCVVRTARARMRVASAAGGVPGTGGAPTTGGTAGTGVTAGNGGTGAVLTVPPECRTTPTPGRTPLRRLTATEYNKTVRDLLGDTTSPADSFPPRVSTRWFARRTTDRAASCPCRASLLDTGRAGPARAARNPRSASPRSASRRSESLPRPRRPDAGRPTARPRPRRR